MFSLQWQHVGTSENHWFLLQAASENVLFESVRDKCENIWACSIICFFGRQLCSRLHAYSATLLGEDGGIQFSSVYIHMAFLHFTPNIKESEKIIFKLLLVKMSDLGVCRSWLLSKKKTTTKVGMWTKTIELNVLQLLRQR